MTTVSVASSRKSAANCRVLVVEDDVICREVLLFMLDQLGYYAEVARDGLEAVSTTRSQLFDVILMDVQMPRMNGMEATQLIRAELDLADQPTIIAMSADTTPRCQQNCLLAGMDGHIGKPVRIEDLDTALGFVFQRHGKPEVRHPCSQDGPPADAAVAAAVYDAHVLESLLLDLGGDGAMGADLIEWFILDCGKRLTAIVAAGHAADPEALAFQAHAIRSASATIGLLALSEVAGEIESAAKAAPAEVDVAWAASLLAAECHRATKALNANLPADVEEQDAKPGIEHLW